MNKKLLIALLALTSVAATAGAAACKPTEKKHECGHVCTTCGKCLDETCTDDACEDKCAGHQLATPSVRVSKINVNTDDETNDGTIGSPFEVSVTQGQSAELTYHVQPSNAENKKFNFKVGGLTDGAFTETQGTGITLTDTGSKLTISASPDAVDCVIEGKADDGSGVSVYLSVKVEVYTAVTSVTSTTLRAPEEAGAEYDYELITALYTNWDIGGGMTERGKKLTEGTEGPTSGLRKPVNLTYYANVYNFGINVQPADATDKDVTVSYDTDGIVAVDAVSGFLTTTGAGETIVTVTSVADPSVSMKVKVTVQDSLYRGILKTDYEEAALASNISGGWNLDADHATAVQQSRYADWHLVMVHCNSDGVDNNQKIFYMGDADRPYGVCLENNVGKNTGAGLENSASLMWAKVQIPAGALTFNVKLKNNDKTHGQYRAVFVAEDGTVTILSAGENGWQGFATENSESTQKFAIPQELKGQTGAIVIEHRLTRYDNNAELQIKSLNFEGQVDVTGVVFANPTATFMTGAREFNVSAQVKPDNATIDGVTYQMAAGSAAGVTVDNGGKVTVTAEAAAGVYQIIATSVGDGTKTATFTLTLTSDEVTVNRWNNKNEILNGVADVSWHFINNGCDTGVGEGADISIRNGVTYAAIELSDRTVKADNCVLTFGARVFHRDGETYPDFEVHVIESDETDTVIRGIGQETDYFHVDTDAVQSCSYDLSAYVGKTVTIQIGIRTGTHAVITYVEFTAPAE